MFTGNVIVGVVKPLIRKEEWRPDILQRRLHTIALMRSLGWGLREFYDRHWANDCLVDGADVKELHRADIWKDRGMACFSNVSRKQSAI